MRFLTGMAAIGGFLFGYDTGVISCAMLPLQRKFQLTNVQQEIVVSSTVLAPSCSSLIGRNLNRTLGRRMSILIAAGVFSIAIGSAVLAFCWDYKSLVLGRIIVGIGIGIASLTTPIYIAEVAMPKIRGQVITVSALLVTVGKFISGMVDGIFDKYMPDSGWRYMLGLAAVPSIVMFWGFLGLPESPRWLAMQGKNEEALAVLKSIRETDEEADNELCEVKVSLPPSRQRHLTDGDVSIISDSRNYDYGRYCEHEDEPNNAFDAESHERDESFFKKMLEMLMDAPTRRALVLGCGIMLLQVQQLSGINTVMYYAASIYEMSQFDELTSVWLAGFTALVQVVGIALSIYLVERTGRRTLVLTSLALVTCSLFGLGASFYLSRVTSQPVMQANEACGSQPALVCNGKTSYCYDCAEISGCGFCGGTCTSGSTSRPFDTKQ